MFRKLFAPRPPRHRGVHRCRGASPHSVLPPSFLDDVRMLIVPADPWAGRYFA